MRLRLLSSGNTLAIHGDVVDRSPFSDYWYTSVGSTTRAGQRVSEDTAFAVSAFYAGVRLISETLGALPTSMFRRTARGKQRARNHPLQETLHDQPNDFQTAQEWKELTAAHAIMRGDGISRKIPGDRGSNSFKLIPLNPSRVEITLTDDHRVMYIWARRTGEKVTLTDTEVFRVRAFSDGLRGLGVVGLAREALGLSLATEEHGARFFSNASTPSGAVKHPKNVSKEAQERFEKTWHRTYGGVENANSVVFLEEGMEWQSLGLSNEDSQFLQTRKFQVVEIARWLRLPPHMLGDMDNAIKANVEEESRNFLLFSLFPWIKRFEHAYRRDLIVADRTFFAEFNLDALMRADLKTRMESYVKAINNGIFSPNEVRELENRNSYDGGDTFRMPLNLEPVGTTTGSALPSLPGSEPGPESSPMRQRRRLAGNSSGNGGAEYVLGVMDQALQFVPEQARVSKLPPAIERLQAIVERAADNIVGKEIKRLADKSRTYANDSDGWAKWVNKFYDAHAGYVSDVLAIDRTQARAYCDDQREDLLTHGVQVLDRWQHEAPASLAQLALGCTGDEQ